MEVEVREVQAHEADAAGQLVAEAYRTLPGSPPVDDNGYAEQLRDVATRAREAVVLVAVEDARLLGCVTYVPGDASPLAEGLRPGEAGMRMLAVDPARQRGGVGRVLVEACIARARKEGRAGLFLHSGEWMSAAHALYGSLGFRRVPDRDWVPAPGIALLGFALDLS